MSRPDQYIYVINPISGDLDKAVLNDTVQAYALEREQSMILFETTGLDHDTGRLRALFLEHRPERVIIAGGDGTIKFVAEALEGEDVILGLIPAGSANGLSVDLNFPQTLTEQLQIAFNGPATELDLICINNKRSLHLSDLGLNAELIRNYEQSSIRGKLGYALQAINTLTDEEVSFVATINANGNTIETEAKMVVIANAQKYGTGVIINPLGKMDDGKFEIIILKHLTLGVFSRIIAGNMPADTNDVFIISTDRANITTNIPVHFQIDGEYCGEETKLDIHILHKQLKVAAPLS